AAAARPARVVDAEPPRFAVLQSGRVEVAARLDEKVTQAGAAHDVHRVLDGVALADAAQVDSHATALHPYRARALVDLDLAIVDERKPPPNRAGIRDGVVLIVVELPDVGGRAVRDVELAAGPLADLARGAQRLVLVGA